MPNGCDDYPKAPLWEQVRDLMDEPVAALVAACNRVLDQQEPSDG